MRRRAPFQGSLAAGAALAACATIALAVGTGLSWLVAYLCGVNLTTIALYGWDKAASRRARGFRIPENVLHLFAFAGGTPGALVAQQLFRHKTAKRSFRTVYWLVVALQAALIALWVWWRGGRG